MGGRSFEGWRAGARREHLSEATDIWAAKINPLALWHSGL